jgi:hypothetical protein
VVPWQPWNCFWYILCSKVAIQQFHLNILCCASSPQQLNKGGTNGLDSPYHTIFGSQYQAFNISKCLAKLFSQSRYSLYYGYVMPMASSKVHWRNWLSNFLISWVVALANHRFLKEKHWSQTKPPNSQQIKINIGLENYFNTLISLVKSKFENSPKWQLSLLLKHVVHGRKLLTIHNKGKFFTMIIQICHQLHVDACGHGYNCEGIKSHTNQRGLHSWCFYYLQSIAIMWVSTSLWTLLHTQTTCVSWSYWCTHKHNKIEM